MQFAQRCQRVRMRERLLRSPLVQREPSTLLGLSPAPIHRSAGPAQVFSTHRHTKGLSEEPGLGLIAVDAAMVLDELSQSLCCRLTPEFLGVPT